MKKKKPNKKEEQEKTPEEIEFEKLSIFFDQYVSSGDLITKSAVICGIKRITYVKGKDLKQFFTEKFTDIQKEILSITQINIGKEANKDSLQKFYEVNQQRNILHYLQRFPGDKAKYPKKLLPLQKGDDMSLDLIFSESGFYILQTKVEKTNKPIIYLILLVILILFIVMFPLWPLNVKIGVLYLLMSILIFLIVFLILTIVVALVGVLFGYEIYIMPNLDDSKKSWKKRMFDPFISIEKRDDPLWFFICRIILIVSLLMMGVIAYFYPTIPKESYKWIKNILSRIYGYGRKKIEEIHYKRNSVSIRDSQTLEDLENI